jgi:hypothetical protein
MEGVRRHIGMTQISGIAIILLFATAVLARPDEQEVLFREDFGNIDNWRPLYFPKIKEYSSYTIQPDGKGSYLKAESNGSASALIHEYELNVYEFPYVRWRWKVENLYEKGDAKKKKGDDYPIRIYLIFKYDPEKAGFREKLKYKVAKILYGEYPPHSGLNYIWGNKEHKERILTNKYTDRIKMILLQKGQSNVGKWKEEEINIVEDYREAFDRDPPDRASIAIMNDSDNTKESSTSYVDYIMVFRKQQIKLAEELPLRLIWDS